MGAPKDPRREGALREALREALKEALKEAFRGAPKGGPCPGKRHSSYGGGFGDSRLNSSESLQHEGLCLGMTLLLLLLLLLLV